MSELEAIAAGVDLEDPPMWNPRLAPSAQGEVYRFAKACYFLDWSFVAVNHACGFPAIEWRKGVASWKKEKAAYDEKILEEIRRKSISQQAEDVLNYSAGIVANHLRRWHEEGTHLPPKDLKVVADILTNVHRVNQLEKNKPTNITLDATNPMAIAQAFDAASEELAEFSDLLPESLKPKRVSDEGE